MASKSGVGCLSVVLILSIGLNVFLLGCNGMTFYNKKDWDRQPINDNKNPSGYADLSELRELANSLGIPEEKTSELSMDGLVSEIKIKLDETIKYHGKVLSEEEMNVLGACLSYEPAILNTVKEYNNFVRKLDGKKIIVLP